MLPLRYFENHLYATFFASVKEKLAYISFILIHDDAGISLFINFSA